LGIKAMNTSAEEIKQVDLLSMFHYILGGITALFSCMFLIHIFIGWAMVSGTFFHDAKGGGPPPAFGWLFVIMGAVFMVLGWSLAVCMLVAGKKLKQRKNRIFCMVVAGIECMQMPLGTVLGVFTLIALNKDSIKEMFAQQAPPPLPRDPQTGHSEGEG
jgi:hypothetical protein